MPGPFGINTYGGSGSGRALYLPRNGPAYETPGDQSVSAFNGRAGQRPMLPQMPQQAAQQAPQQQMLPQVPQAPQRLQENFGLRQNIAKGMAAAGYSPQDVAKQGLEYLTGTPVQGQGNYFQNKAFAQDANARENTATGAVANVNNSAAGMNTANANATTQMLPTMQQIGQANAGLTQAQGQQITQMLPGQVQAQQLGNTQQALMIPSLAQIGQNQARAGQIANQAAGAAAPYAGPAAAAQVNATNAGASQMKAYQDEINRLRTIVQHYQTVHQTNDPFSGMDAGKTNTAGTTGSTTGTGTQTQQNVTPPGSVSTGQQAAPQQQSQGGPPRISGDEEFHALPPGTTFVGPDGVPRTKPKAQAAAPAGQQPQASATGSNPVADQLRAMQPAPFDATSFMRRANQ